MTSNTFPPSLNQTLEQERARQAWINIRQVKGGIKDKEYSQLAKGAPADIQTFGLGQTLAFWYAKNESHHHNLFVHTSDWVLKQMKVTGESNLLTWLMDEHTSSDDYRRATTEAIAFLIWVKRFAEAEIG